MASGAYSKGSSNTITWSLSNGPEGSGFGALVTKTPDLLQPEQAVTIPPGARSHTFTGLSEARHYYHLFTIPLGGTCSAGASSAPVSTIQDTTPPVVAIVSPQDGGVEAGSSVTVTGTLNDPPGGDAPSGSGPLVVQVFLTSPNGEGRGIWADARSGTWTATFTGLARGAYSVAASGYDTVTNLGTAPTRQVLVLGTDNLPPPPSTSTALVGGADGTAYSNVGLPGSSEVHLAQGQFFNFSLRGRYEGAPASRGWSCLPAGSDLHCSDSGSLLTTIGVDVPNVMPSSFTMSGVSLTLTSLWPSPAGTFTLTASIFSGLTLRCDGLAVAQSLAPDPPNQAWGLISPNVGCEVL